ncbi:MAG: hypothetical protein KGR47_03035 [Acidobacteria bacterium]|nr:hypothetical protein [Acidobacteriota bacterium]
MSALLEQFKALFRIGLYLLAAFVVIQLWQDPSGAAHATMDAISGIGQFFSSLIDRTVAFVKSFSG